MLSEIGGANNGRRRPSTIRVLASMLMFATGTLACSSTTPSPEDAGQNSGLDAGAIDAAPSDAGAPDAAPMMPMACPRPDGDPVMGDVNGDGIHDVADAPALGNYLFRGGPPPVCTAAADYRADRLIAIEDVTRNRLRVASHGVPEPTFDPTSCRVEHWRPASCVPMSIVVRAPSPVRAQAFEATVVVHSPEAPIQSWSLSVRTEGCRISVVTPKGTRAADVWDEPPGLRHLGYTVSQVVEGGAVALADLSLAEDIVLPPEPTSILALSIIAELPASGCTTCSIALGDGLGWLGDPLDTVLVSGGRAYRPEVSPTIVELCAP